MDNIKEDLARALHDGLIEDVEVTEILEDYTNCVVSLWYYDDVRYCDDLVDDDPNKSKLKNHECIKLLNQMLDATTQDALETLRIIVSDYQDKLNK